MFRLLHKAVLIFVRAVVTLATRWMRPGRELSAAMSELEAQKQRAEIAEDAARYAARDVEDLRQYGIQLEGELALADNDVLLLEAELAVTEAERVEPPHDEERARR